MQKGRLELGKQKQIHEYGEKSCKKNPLVDVNGAEMGRFTEQTSEKKMVHSDGNRRSFFCLASVSCVTSTVGLYCFLGLILDLCSQVSTGWPGGEDPGDRPERLQHGRQGGANPAEQHGANQR